MTLEFWIGIFLGMWLGGLLGVAVMALVQINRGE